MPAHLHCIIAPWHLTSLWSGAEDVPVCRSHSVSPHEFDQTAYRAVKSRVEGASRVHRGWRPPITAFNHHHHHHCSPSLLTVTGCYEAPLYVMASGFYVQQRPCSQSGKRDRAPTTGTQREGQQLAFVEVSMWLLVTAINNVHVIEQHLHTHTALSEAHTVLTAKTVFYFYWQVTQYIKIKKLIN